MYDDDNIRQLFERLHLIHNELDKVKKLIEDTFEGIPFFDNDEIPLTDADVLHDCVTVAMNHSKALGDELFCYPWETLKLILEGKKAPGPNVKLVKQNTADHFLLLAFLSSDWTSEYLDRLAKTAH